MGSSAARRAGDPRGVLPDQRLQGLHGRIVEEAGAGHRVPLVELRRNAGFLTQQVGETGAVEPQHLAAVLRPDGRRPWLVRQQGHLAEDVTGAEPGDARLVPAIAAGDIHAESARADDVEGPRGIALMEDRGARAQADGPEVRREARQRDTVQAGSTGQGPEVLERAAAGTLTSSAAATAPVPAASAPQSGSSPGLCASPRAIATAEAPDRTIR